MWKTATILLGIVLVLITLGIVMLASTSGIQGRLLYHDPSFFVKRQVVALILGAVCAILTSWVDYRYWRRLAIPLAVFSLALLVLVLIPGIGSTIKGSSRWLRVGPINFQPSELAKLSLIVLLAWWMTRVQRHAHEFNRGLFLPLIFLFFFLGLIFVEPDFGSTMLIGVVGMMMMFVGGTRPGYLLVSGTTFLSLFTLAVMHNAERMRRVTAFLNPEKYAEDAAFQLLNAIYAFVTGGGRGVGLGQGLQKHFYLPEAHTDFIFAIIGEELGLFASLGVVVLFLGLFLCGIRITFHSPDQFGKLLAFGITIMLSVQAMINIAVVTGSMPTKGLALPFISYGGSSMLISMTMIGVLVNIARQAGELEESDDAGFIKDAVRRF